MNLFTQTVEEKQAVLIVAKKNYPFIEILKTELKKYGVEIFFSSQVPHSLSAFHYCFFINETYRPHYRQPAGPRLIFIYVNKKHSPITDTKVIDVDGDNLRKQDVDRILWFSLSETKETLLKFTTTNLPKPYQTKINWRLYFKKHLTKKKLIAGLVSLLILLHLSFIPPLALSSLLTYRAMTAFKQEDIASVNSYTSWSLPLLNLSKALYSLVRPTYLLFSVAIISDNIIDIDDSAQDIIRVSIDIFQNTREMEKLLFRENKTAEEKAYLALRIRKLGEQIDRLETSLTTLNQKIPDRSDLFQKIKTQVAEATDAIGKLKKILPFADNIFAKDTEKKYLIFFANNMELRPGGGFIGSFGILPVKDYTIGNIQIYDVYDADGQLTIHVEPPAPIKKYLGVPHLFLRDSNFSPDFLENYQKAQFFLEKEMKMSDFSGTILISTTAIKNLLSAFGDIYLPDFNETINEANFYLKAQMHAEDNFFPGSIQKKSFLSTLARQIFINLEEVSVKKLVTGIKKSFDEKQMVMYMDNPDIQTVIDQFFWSGRMIEPRCSSQTKDCLVDYLFPYDANVGANKVNFFINRSIYLKTMINDEGVVRHLLSIQYRNDSPSAAFPGGNYRNYFQVLLPPDSIVKQITKDGVLIEESMEEQDKFKKLGFFFEVPPQKKTEIKIEYQLGAVIHKGINTYQLIVQKQIASNNSDFAMELNLPKNIQVLGQNYSPLVKDNQIIYNTSLSADKIFFTELTKQ